MEERKSMNNDATNVQTNHQPPPFEYRIQIFLDKFTLVGLQIIYKSEPKIII